MQIPIQALELARFADRAASADATRWLQLKPIGPHMMQASATNGAMLGQFAWLTMNNGGEEIYLNAKHVMEILKASSKRNRLLGGSLTGAVLQIGNETPKPLEVGEADAVHYPPVDKVVPDENLDDALEGTPGSCLRVDTKHFEAISKWLKDVQGTSTVRFVFRGDIDPIRVDVPVFDTGGRAVFVVMPSRL